MTESQATEANSWTFVKLAQKSKNTFGNWLECEGIVLYATLTQKLKGERRS